MWQVGVRVSCKEGAGVSGKMRRSRNILWAGWGVGLGEGGAAGSGVSQACMAGTEKGPHSRDRRSVGTFPLCESQRSQLCGRITKGHAEGLTVVSHLYGTQRGSHFPDGEERSPHFSLWQETFPDEKEGSPHISR